MAPLAALAQQTREQRKDTRSDNPFIAMQEQASSQIVTALDQWRSFAETLAERTFLNVFGSPALQAAVGIDPASASPLCKAPKNPLHRQLLQTRMAELKARIPEGGLRAAVVRALIYVGLSRRAIDERGFEMARRIRQAHGDMPLADFKALVREQFAILILDQDAALAALPSMLPPEPGVRRTALGLVKQVLAARGDVAGDEQEKLEEVARLFGVDAEGNARHARGRHPKSDSARDAVRATS
jgi:hypothetical protein